MNLFAIIILLLNFVYLFGDEQIYKIRLRGFCEQEESATLNNNINNAYKKIYNMVLEYAKQNKNKFQFTIMCTAVLVDHSPDNKDIPSCFVNKKWKEQNQNIQIELYEQKVINKLNAIFPDSNITKLYRKCCNYYTISW